MPSLSPEHGAIMAALILWRGDPRLAWGRSRGIGMLSHLALNFAYKVRNNKNIIEYLREIRKY
jgi:hypothetical protein